MSLNASGTISIGGSTTGQSINLELGRGWNATTSMNESSVRSLAGVASGVISLTNFYGKSTGKGIFYAYIAPSSNKVNVLNGCGAGSF